MEENQEELKVVEFFGGIGAIRKAFERLGIPHKVVDYVEIDEFAVKSYNAVFGTNFEPQDITKWDKNIDVDLIMHGSPCQDFSIAGLQKGGDEGSGTRSSLMYETLRNVKRLKPKYVIWENVKNLISEKHWHNFQKYLNIMDEFGYNNYYQVLNAKDYGIPQNRERIFTVSIRKDIDERTFYFPDKKPLTLRLKDLLESNVDEKYYLSDDKINAISHWNSYQNPLERVMGNNSVANTLTAREGGTDHAGMLTYSDALTDTTNLYAEGAVNRLGSFYDTEDKTSSQGGSIYDKDGLSPTITTGHGYAQPFVIDENEKPNSKVITHNIKQNVKVRVYNVDTDKLSKVLRESKEKVKLNNNEIAEKLDIPTTQVEHYFRTDNYFAIPDDIVWPKLKEILQIDTDEFDKSIMTFEIKEGTYDSSNRVYGPEGIAPTLDTSDDKKIIEYKGKEVELPTMCASRGRNLENPTNREPGQKLQQTIEVNTEGVSNTITTVEKDNYVLEPDNRDAKIEVVGNYKPSGHSCGRIIDPNGITPTVMENHGAVTAIVEDNAQLKYVGSIKNKDIVGDGKQNLSRNASVGDRVYDSNGVSTTITAEGGGVGGHSGLYTVDDEVKVVGNYMPSGYESGRILDTTGIAPTIKENHGTVYAIAEENNEADIDNPLKGISGQSWQFEQNVYSEDSKLIRTIKAGEGSGNIPKVIEKSNQQTFIPTNTSSNSSEVGYIQKGENGTQHQSNTVYDENGVARTLSASDYKAPMMVMTKQEVVDELNKNAKHQHELVNNEDGIARTLVAGTHGNANAHTKTVVEDTRNINAESEEKDKNMKEQLCDYLVDNNMVEEYDVINHGYTDHRFETLESGKDIVMSKNIAPTITTRPDELGVAVSNKSAFSESDKQMITEDGNIKRYINSDIVDKFEEGQIADISFPNGYNKGPRVHNECPTINGTTVQSFVTKESSNEDHLDIINNTETGYLEAYPGDGVNLSSRMKYQRGNVQPQMAQTLTTSGGNDRGVVIPNNLGLRIRKLTPKECWRLMGFDDEDFEKAEKVNSNAQLYKQAGNSIVVNVLEAILTSLFRPDTTRPKRTLNRKLF